MSAPESSFATLLTPALLAIIAAALPTHVCAQDRLVLDLSAMGVAASGGTDVLPDEDRSGGVYAADLAWDHDTGPSHLDVDLSSTYYGYQDPARQDRWNNRVAVAYGHDLADGLLFTTRVDYSSRIATLDSQAAEQEQIRGVLSYTDGPDRVRLTGGWRWRDFRDGTVGSGNGPVAEIEYRHRFADRSQILIETRWEEFDTQVARRGYDRVTVHGEAQFRLARRTTLEVGAYWKDWTYRDRYVGLEKRHDSSFSPEVAVAHEFAPDWTVDVRGSILWRNSNDPQSDETVKRGFIRLTHRFRII